MGSPIAAPSEVPISDPGADGTYPILGDTSGLGGGGLGASPAASGGGGGGGLINDLMQTANQLGASQAIDLLKGLIMPAIMQGVQHGGAGAAAGAPGAALPTGALPTGALPGVAGLSGATGLPGAAACRVPLACRVHPACRVPPCRPPLRTVPRPCRPAQRPPLPCPRAPLRRRLGLREYQAH